MRVGSVVPDMVIAKITPTIPSTTRGIIGPKDVAVNARIVL